ncbi:MULTISPECIES: hypothetical protein [Bradyrhizobium]|jgi:hypothetical protein|uniref:Uncharacterized protein n=2 Tax=Bradyrhizobium TaxID=374 RepID=A0A2U8P2G0_9BRAD|nr:MULTISPECIES: hypothetical protein [Bradyrhizobium]GMP08754.1 hypothetical protein TM239_52800 [Bradyrhizobium sp. TM239]AWL91910.1 hypothetical protein CIT37_06600 [Bradyrhizobium ottawaense]MBB4258410.1 hypothetical protein [Bradyrhizobium sp. CIR3A]MBB4366052.1 hypothetical protein [Bradyrhizobium sp. CIR18]MBB4380123.1 hypothetical protein [Bradyrhizobium sp. SBR1B]
MIIPTHFGPAIPMLRAQAWSASAFGRLVSLDLMAVDLRFALASVVARPLIQAADALVRHVMGRAWRGARFAEDITAAATMVAAARH